MAVPCPWAHSLSVPCPTQASGEDQGSCWPDGGITRAARRQLDQHDPAGPAVSCRLVAALVPPGTTGRTSHSPGRIAGREVLFPRKPGWSSPRSPPGAWDGGTGVPLHLSLGCGCDSHLQLRDRECPNTPAETARTQGADSLLPPLLPPPPCWVAPALAGAPCSGGTIWPGLPDLGVMPDLGSHFCS